MPKKDWIEIVDKFDDEFIQKFLNSQSIFIPSENFKNPFDSSFKNFNSENLEKSNPANWIPIYKKEDLSDFLIANNLMPIRSGSGEFFFYRGNIIFELENIDFENIPMNTVKQIDNFIPLSLKVDFQRNENAYLNKAMAFGIINDFTKKENLKILEKELNHKNSSRLLYGQFGKIKTSFDFSFKTSKGCKIINRGFQFEMDLVLESETEILIFEAKSGDKKTKTFSLLQLYYPLIYIELITTSIKKVRTIFIDITIRDNIEDYRLIEIEFKNSNFDEIKVLNSKSYRIENHKNLLESL